MTPDDRPQGRTTDQTQEHPEHVSEHPKGPQILISDRQTGLPYSKGLMASQVMVTGLSPYRSYQVAEAVEERLLERGLPSVTWRELSELTRDVIEEIAGERYAENYERWRQVETLDVPVVLLIGGTTGVGKSTLATQLATRLGIVRVVATDAVREVMRALFSHELMPTLHASSFEAGGVLREPPSKDAVIVGFREQTAAVAVGLQALLDRAAIEGTSLIIEGAHVVPGFLDPQAWQDRALVVPVVVTIEDEETHRDHFVARAADHAGRPATRYLDAFENIRRVQRYIKSQALSHGVPVIPNYNFDRSLSAVIDLVMEHATERAAPRRGIEDEPRPAPVAGTHVVAPAGALGATEGGIT
jgi:2-phosphoglycerate kinase